MKRLFLAPLLKWASRLRHPTLFRILAALFVLDAFVPDFVPFVDEIMLGLATLLVGQWKKPSAGQDPRR